ncbi:hypothetical protein IRT38_00070 (plasmid) [Acinetobacter sp. SK-43]|uniref:hypothetical protein n=1 Tax=Acinetobacter sp. SK-43 TaxID=2785295 RepID=UPI00188C17BD|nr:hypothetical protein [Acinetobacter sp. SK-43]MBF4453808.1 hypothetical protein [Acinetobacter sp. SK-43]
MNNSSTKKPNSATGIPVAVKFFGCLVLAAAFCIFVLWYLTGSTPVDTIRSMNEIITAPSTKEDAEKSSLEKTHDKIAKFASN